jgi:hypothetical protein
MTSLNQLWISATELANAALTYGPSRSEADE